MVAIINVVSSPNCPACKACGELLERLRIDHPDVMISYLDANDRHIRRFQKLNLSKPVSTIKNPALRQQYENAGLTQLSGLPTIYITSTHRPNRILDMMIGCISPNSDYEAKDRMRQELSLFISKAKAYDRQFNVALAGKPKRRSGY